MGSDFNDAMRQALQLVRSQNVMEATRVIQRALVDGEARPLRPGTRGSAGRPRRSPGRSSRAPRAKRKKRRRAPESLRRGDGPRDARVGRSEKS